MCSCFIKISKIHRSLILFVYENCLENSCSKNKIQYKKIVHFSKWILKKIRFLDRIKIPNFKYSFESLHNLRHCRYNILMITSDILFLCKSSVKNSFCKRIKSEGLLHVWKNRKWTPLTCKFLSESRQLKTFSRGYRGRGECLKRVIYLPSTILHRNRDK